MKIVRMNGFDMCEPKLKTKNPKHLTHHTKKKNMKTQTDYTTTKKYLKNHQQTPPVIEYHYTYNHYISSNHTARQFTVHIDHQQTLTVSKNRTNLQSTNLLNFKLTKNIYFENQIIAYFFK